MLEGDLDELRRAAHGHPHGHQEPAFEDVLGGHGVAQADVYASITSGPTTALPGASVSYTALFGNNGPDDSNATTRTVTIPGGATVTNLGGGTLTGNVLDFGTVASASGSSASFTYTYTLPNTPTGHQPRE